MGEHKLPKNKSEKVMPAFVFARKRDIEVEGGFTLAGRLVLDKGEQEQAPGIVQQLLNELRSGRLPTDAVTYGWRGGGRPPNAIDTDDDKVMSAWSKGCLVIEVRIDPRNDGLMRVDSDIMRQL